MSDLELEKMAKDFATMAHKGQVRKYTNEPYITHPTAVVVLVRAVPHDSNMICAAWLHDVVEDCNVELRLIERLFNLEVAQLVKELTDVSKPEDGNRATRKCIDRRHLSEASIQAKTIKLADLIDNSCSIIERDKEFAKVYLREKQLLLTEALTQGEPLLYSIASRIVEDNLAILPIIADSSDDFDDDIPF